MLDDSEDPIESFWAIQQRICREDASEESIKFLERHLADENPTVRATAAEAMAQLGYAQAALPVFKKLLSETEPNLLLYVARTLALSVDDVRPIETAVRQARERMLAPPGSRRPWKDFNYSAFTTWALEWALIKSRLNRPQDFGWNG